MRARALPLLLALLGLPSSAQAHDYWLEPRDFTPEVDEPFTVDLVLGDHFVREQTRPHDPQRARRFELRTRCKTLDLTQGLAEGADPVIEDRSLERAGLVLIGLERDWVDITLADDQFTEYLDHEGLDEVARMRDEQGHRAQERERYIRSVKTLLRVGDRSHRALHRKRLGHAMEIVLLDDPYRRDPGERVRAKVLLEGKPLAGVRVTALHRRADGKVRELWASTDRRGVAEIEVDAGVWLLRSVHMVPCTGTCEGANWRSYWASFSFAVD